MMYQGVSAGLGMPTKFATTSTKTSQMIFSKGPSAGDGQHRQRAIAEGDKSVQQLNQRIQFALAAIDVCPMGFQWMTVNDGYLCSGGNHFIENKEIELILEQTLYQPSIDLVNCPFPDPTASMFTPVMQWAPFKKPPMQLPRWSTPWISYHRARASKKASEHRQELTQNISDFNHFSSSPFGY